jgi:signal transduction histidine kinase
LETHHGSPVLSLLERLSQAGPHDLGALRNEARKLHDDLLRLSDPDQRSQHETSVPRSAYDEWVVDLFRATEMAVPREGLLRDFARQFALVHGHATKQDSGARILILHYLAAQGDAQAQISGFYQRGMSEDQWRRFQAHLAQHQHDPALRRLFQQRLGFECDYLPYMHQGGYHQAVFDVAMVRAKGEYREDWAAYGPNAWITAHPLFGEDLREGHAVVLLYPNTGQYFEYREPPKSGQDLRLLDVLAAVYRQLDNQIKNLAVQIMRAREQLLARLGPVVIHHEVGGLTRQVSGVLCDALDDWQRFEQAYEPPAELAGMGERLRLARQWTDKVVTTADAFMNLERRGKVDSLDVARVMAQIERMVVVRCGAIGAKLDVHPVMDADPTETTPRLIRNDATLVMHALLNLVNNALDAMEERYEAWQQACEQAQAQGQAQPAPNRSVIEIRWTHRALPRGCVGWEVVNTGPPIAPQVGVRVFERGFTTRSSGHGQGLHLVRMSAQYCGGDVALMNAEELAGDQLETVGFAYWVAADHQVTRELSL